MIQFFLYFGSAIGQCPSWHRNNDASTGCWKFDEFEKKCTITNPACGKIEGGQDWIASQELSK